MRHFLTRLEDINVKHLLSAPSLGLTEYEVRALVALSEGPRTPTEVGEMASIPRTKTYEVLNSLAEKGIVDQSDDRPLRFRLAPGALGRVLSEVERSYLTAKNFLGELMEVHKSGSLGTLQSELEEAVRRAGFSDFSKDESFYSLTLPQGIKLIITSEAMMEGISLESILEMKRKAGAQYAVVLIETPPSHEMLRFFETNGVLLTKYKMGSISETITRKFEEIELLLATYRSFARDFSNLSKEIDEQISRCYSSLHSLKSGRKELPGWEALSSRVDETEESLSRAKYDRLSLSSLWKEVEKNLMEKGGFGNSVTSEMETAIEGLSSLGERVRTTSKEIEDLEHRLKGPVKALSHGPPEKPTEEDVIDQKEMKSSLHGFLSSYPRRNLTLALLVGEHGSGKTMMARYLGGRINAGLYGKALAALTSSMPSFLETYNSLVTALSAEIAKREVIWPAALERQRTFFGALRGYRELVRELLEKHGIEHIFWFVDDFDHTLEPGELQALSLREMKSFLDSQADLPLTVLLALTNSSYETLRTKREDIVSRISPAFVFKIQGLSRDGVRELVERSIPGLSPSGKLLALLVERTDGNPRRLIHILNESLLNASAHGGMADERLISRVALSMKFS